MIWFFSIIFIGYSWLIIYLAIGFTKQQNFQSITKTPKIGFSILVPFRNEAKNLPRLLTSLEKLNYSSQLFEVIFIDDDSTDKSSEIVNTFVQNHANYKFIQNERQTNSPKKDAIVSGLKIASFEWIVTTDADCTVPEEWLIIFNNFILAKNPNMIVAPVYYSVKNTFLEQFQLFDFMSLQGATIGGFGSKIPFLCNGANLAYKKTIFTQVNGFIGNTSIASGDDIFLFEKFLHHDKSAVQYLKNKAAIVTTFPVNGWKSLIQQRIRWASKTGNVSLPRTKLIGVIIFLGNLFVLKNFFFSEAIQQKIGLLFIKISVDLLLLLPTLNFFGKQKNWWKYYFLSSLLYPFFSVAIVLLATFSKYSWKGRKFRV